MATATQVFATYELLEGVLHHLPTRDLLLAQRVNRDFRDVITRSHKLQRALFLIPAGQKPSDQASDVADTDSALARLSMDNRVPWSSRESGIPMTVYINPLLEDLLATLADESEVKNEHRLQRSYRYPEASWRNMLLSQPPAKVFLVYTRTAWGPRSSDLGPMAWETPGGEVTRAGDLMMARPKWIWKHEFIGQCLERDSSWRDLEDNQQIEELSVEAEK